MDSRHLLGVIVYFCSLNATFIEVDAHVCESDAWKVQTNEGQHLVARDLGSCERCSRVILGGANTFTPKHPDVDQACDTFLSNTSLPTLQPTVGESEVIDDCSPNRCRNGGICTDLVNGYQCTCSIGFSGIDCEINIDDCSPNRCQHGGICTDLVNGYQCDCSSTGFQGNECEIIIDDCSPNRCQNGGICTDLVNGYQCTCSIGFSGANCDIGAGCSTGWPVVTRPNVDNSGWTAVSPDHKFECGGQIINWRYNAKRPHLFRAVVWRPTGESETMFRITGVNDIPFGPIDIPTTYIVPRDERITVQVGDMIGWSAGEDVCKPNPCRHNGNCTKDADAYICACADGFTGSTCEINIDECVSSPCQHNGACNDQIDAYTCTCTEDFGGQYCQTSRVGCLTGWPTLKRAGADNAGWTAVAPDHQFECSGQVIEWQYVAERGDPFCAVVWRQTGESETMFRIVGVNDIPPGPTNIPTTYKVPRDERITVQTGDMIGWSAGQGVVSYNGGGDFMVRKKQGNLWLGLAANQTIDVDGHYFAREYSIKARILGEICYEKLGVENRIIPDKNMESSSRLWEWGGIWRPHLGRLNRDGVPWSATVDDTDPWLQVDIGYQTFISGVITQGDGGYSLGGNQVNPMNIDWVTSFKISTFLNTTSDPEIFIKDGSGTDMVFAGNTDRASEVTTTFPETIHARIVRFKPLAKHGTHFAMKVEILGCKK